MYLRPCILGGSGFVGRHLVAQLARQGLKIRVLTRHRERHRELLVLPGVELRECNIHDPAQLAHCTRQQDAIINLVGILNERRDNGKDFEHAHVELSNKVLEVCEKNNIRRLLHMSALHADAVQGPSYYLRSKGAAQALVHAATNINVTSFCPSVIFGPDDAFFNRFAALLRMTPGVLPLACGHTRFAPVYVGDVVSAFVKSLNNPHTWGQSYNLCGPENFTLQQLVEYTARQLGLKRKVIALGDTSSRLMATVFQYLPFYKPMTLDNYRSMQVDSICDAPFPDIFAVRPKRIGEIVPGYLARRNGV